MPREQDMAALLKRLLAKEVTDVDDNEVLDEIITLKDPLPPADALTVAETADFRSIAGFSSAGFCEAAELLAGVDSQADWQAGTIPAEADSVTAPGSVLLALAGGGLYYSSATLETKELDLGGSLPSRPVLLFPTMDNASPAGTSGSITRYRMKANPGDAWGAWETPTSLPSGGFLTLTAPLRYLQMEIELATTDTTQTPILIAAGVFD